MKVALVLTQNLGGPADLTMSLARELSGRPAGPQVTVLGPAPAARDGADGIRWHQVSVRSKADIRGFGAVSAALRRLAPDIIHAQDRRAGLVCMAVAGSTPVVLTFHGVPDRAAGRWVQAGPLHGRPPGVTGGSRLVADALVSRRIRCTVAPSQAMAAFLHRELRVPVSRLQVVPNGVALPESRRPAQHVRTFATAGTFAPCKATPVLVEAFLVLAASRPELRLKMIGDGAERRACEELAGRSRRAGQIEFAGYRADVAAQLRAADVFVLPSVNENSPLALLQAMALGLACIAAGVGGIPEILDGDCGILVPPGDPGALRTAMLRTIERPDLARSLGEAARRRVAERYSLARCADDHLRLWTDLAGHGRE